jgi:hypothetical protein
VAKLNRSQIHERALAVLEANPQGIRWTDLLRSVEQGAEDTPHNSVHGGIHNLLRTRTSEIVKVARGTYQLAKYVDTEANSRGLADRSEPSSTPPVLEGAASVPQEAAFYSGFAEWLIENDEATLAEPLGGAGLGGKWGTPDVLAVLKPRGQDIYKFAPQIIAAEIKSTPHQPVVAFGQAVAYRLFAHKSYIAVPRSTSAEDISRLTSLCSLHGVGLVTFLLDVGEPDFRISVLPAAAEPDMFYVNAMLDRLKTSDARLLNRLFS